MFFPSCQKLFGVMFCVIKKTDPYSTVPYITCFSVEEAVNLHPKPYIMHTLLCTQLSPGIINIVFESL